MRRMLVHSDNRATDILLKDLGGPAALHDWLQQSGVSGLRVDRTIHQLLTDKRDLWDRRDSSTPTAMVDLLRRIYRAELIKPQSRNYLLDLMAQCETGKNRMKALLPGVPVEHKTGTLTGLSDDVGSPTRQNSRRWPRERRTSTTATVPSRASPSSSDVSSTAIEPRCPGLALTNLSAAVTIAATEHFMSAVPRPTR